MPRFERKDLLEKLNDMGTLASRSSGAVPARGCPQNARKPAGLI